MPRKGQKMSLEGRRKASEAATGRKATPETRAAISAGMRKRFEDPAARAKCASFTGKKHSPETLIKMSRTQKALAAADPSRITVMQAGRDRAVTERGSYHTRLLMESFKKEDIKPQAVVECYAVDFSIPSLQLIFEADGVFWHRTRLTKDAARDAYLQRRGWTTVRFAEFDLYAISKERGWRL